MAGDQVRGQDRIAQANLLAIADNAIDSDRREFPNTVIGVAARDAVFQRPAILRAG